MRSYDPYQRQIDEANEKIRRAQEQREFDAQQRKRREDQESRKRDQTKLFLELSAKRASELCPDALEITMSTNQFNAAKLRALQMAEAEVLKDHPSLRPGADFDRQTFAAEQTKLQLAAIPYSAHGAAPNHIRTITPATSVNLASAPPVIGMSASEKEKEVLHLLNEMLALGGETQETFQLAKEKIERLFPKLFSAEVYTKEQHEKSVVQFATELKAPESPGKKIALATEQKTTQPRESKLIPGRHVTINVR